MADEGHKVTIYYSSVSGNVQAKKYHPLLTRLLDTLHVAYQEIDISLDENAEHKNIQKNGGNHPLPTVFQGTTYIGGYQDCVDANECGELRHFLGME